MISKHTNQTTNHENHSLILMLGIIDRKLSDILTVLDELNDKSTKLITTLKMANRGIRIDNKDISVNAQGG